MDINMIKKEFKKGKNRGPEFSKLVSSANGSLMLGFHRLAINGLNEASNQPLVHDGITLICNGEIYNYNELYSLMDVTPNTGSDCEVIIHLYKKYGIEQTLIMLDGVFAFVLYDSNINKVFVARDPFGVRPLYKLHINITVDNQIACVEGFASELKMIESFYNIDPTHSCTKQFEPGTYSVFNYASSKWVSNIINKTYFIPTFPSMSKEYNPMLIANELTSAVYKRCCTTEREVACLLSGGLDSSLIAALVAKYFKGKYNKQIETYSIGLANSEDIKYAKIVAEYINSKHTEIIVTEEEMFNAIPEVIKAIESYDTTTVRASIGNYLIGKYIAKHSQAKVVFNGDGSDELFGGYLYMNKCPDDIEFDKETRRLLKDIHLFDVLRSDKSISSNGLEPRTPFLDKNFVQAVLSIPINRRNHVTHNSVEKYLLRESCGFLSLLPNSILYRKKEAFSDGVSSQGRSLFTILQEFIANHYNSQGMIKREPSIEVEKQYYREIFDKEFPNSGHILPYFWMPKYTNATDPSARTLDIYEEEDDDA
jgi:asparagine synthase (glutamine-hydrolysing)